MTHEFLVGPNSCDQHGRSPRQARKSVEETRIRRCVSILWSLPVRPLSRPHGMELSSPPNQHLMNASRVFKRLSVRGAEFEASVLSTEQFNHDRWRAWLSILLKFPSRRRQIGKV